MKTKFYFILLLVILNAPVALYASNSKREAAKIEATTRSDNKMSKEEAERITKRVEEIRSMDRSKMTASEKKELRKELRSYKERIRKDTAVIYISAGTLLVIILILLLI